MVLIKTPINWIQKLCYVIQRHENVAIQKNICRGKTMVQSIACISKHGKGSIDIFFTRIQDLC